MVINTIKDNFINLSREDNEIFIFKNIELLSNFAVDTWIRVSEQAIKNRGRFTVAVSGGKSPITLYKKLSDLKNSVPWVKTHVFLADERFVSHEDKESNYNMLNQTLLRHIKIPGKNIHPISTNKNTPQASALKYEKELISYFRLKIDPNRQAQGEFPKFDLILLGIGEDGHTASLFPGNPSLRETGRMAVAVRPSGKYKKQRITLTFPVINNAHTIVFLASGIKKAVILKEILDKRNSLLPAAMVKPKRGTLFFLIDKSAGSRLSQ
jgi:6-phosphogluconolactonase